MITANESAAERELELQVQQGLQDVEALLADSVAASRDLVDDLTRHLAVAGGKRLRPVLSLICSHLGAPHRAQSDPVITAATGVELTHLASLYHDDVMDSAPSRRGVDSAQMIWGNNRAILAGDLLFARASTLMATLGKESILFHVKTFERLCMGQLNETFGPPEGEDPVDFYLQVLADKTGSLVAAAAFFGALHAGAGPEIAEAVREFGENIGVAFQLADDVLDITSPAEVTGKTPGTDLLEGVDTMPLLLLRQQLADGTLDSEGAQILELLAGDLQNEENLAAVVELLGRHSVVEQTRALAREWAEAAIAALDALPESEAKEALVAFAVLMVDRAA
ncbi:polyprenyl synthetase family protein [Actinomyces minihominis]|uniref:polyprenyl synthetase family protein n=1 Tax=Actinomyces minihominis TaxID=2002838 RepID=UPI003520ADB2